MPLIPKPVRVFISYSHRHRKHAVRLDEVLVPHRRTGHLVTWWDEKLSAGSRWQKEIDFALDQAHIVLLLITIEFLASDQCFGELLKALERERKGAASVLPIILDDCNWVDVPEIRALNLLPRNGKSILSSRNKSAVWTEVSTRIRQKADELSAQGLQTQAAEARPIPDFLPYLCNRAKQEEDFTKALGQHNPRRPFVCILTGGPDEAHREFIQRLQRGPIPKVLRLSSATGTLEPLTDLRWFGLDHTLEPEALFAPQLSTLLNFEGGNATRIDVAAAVARHAGLAVIRYTVSAEEWANSGPILLDRFVKFWQEWPVLNQGQHLLVFLSIRCAPEADSGLAKALQPLENIDSPLLVRLAPVSRGDVDLWALDAQVQSYCDTIHFEQPLNLLYAGRPKIPMGPLAENLNFLMHQHRRVRHA